VSDDLTAWLRAEVEARLKLAREASPHSDGHWWRRTTDPGDGGPPEPVGHLYGGEPLTDTDGEALGGEFIVVYDEGAPSDAQFDHIAANDPQDVIARCEAELAILDLYERQAAKNGENAMEEDRAWTLAPVICLLGSGYASRPGYREEWKP
jgi:hypothetical protein